MQQSCQTVLANMLVYQSNQGKDRCLLVIMLVLVLTACPDCVVRLSELNYDTSSGSNAATFTCFGQQLLDATLQLHIMGSLMHDRSLVSYDF